MKVLAVDIGASSGRFIVVDYNKGFLLKEETYRFSNAMEYCDGKLEWNFDSLIKNIKTGLRITLNKHSDIVSVGVDTWAVDYGKLDVKGTLISNPVAYRDERNEKAAKELLKTCKYETIYCNSGIQFLNFNTLFQLYAEKKESFDKVLLIPDLINYFLTGEKRTELTNLSTTALYNPITRDYSEENFKLIGFSKNIFPQIIFPSTLVGKIKKELCDEEGIYQIPVIAVGSHDTASAIASINLSDHTAYLSSGTWSLLGVELSYPIINEMSYKYNYTNEIGLNHSVRFLKNIMGLFIVQELKKDFEKTDKKISFQTMQDEAKKIDNNDIYIDIDDELFQKPGDMLCKYYRYLDKTNQQQNNISIGQIVRSIYESMAFKYVEKMNELELITQDKKNKLIVVGGGINAKLLNQLIANALNIIVETGETEATVYGNAIAQLIYFNKFSSLNEARKELAKITNKEKYEPKDQDITKIKYQKYLSITKGGK